MVKKYDLVLAGTGFASTFFLKKYLDKCGPGKKILVLERGHLYTHRQRLADIKGENYPGQVSPRKHESTFINLNPAKPWMFDVNFGGSSNCWWACTPRFMPNDFRLRSLYGRGEDWPITYSHLEKYYCEAEEIMNISGPEQTPFPKSKPYPHAAHRLNAIDKTMQRSYGETQWISQPTGRPSEPIGKRSMCCSNYTCNLCPVNSKFSIENSMQYLYEDPRVELKFGLQVYKIEFENGSAKQVIAAACSKTGVLETEVFEGEVIALGANPIFNAHILLNSGDSNALTGAGIGEQKGLFAVAHLGKLDNVGGNTSITANGYMMYDGAFRKDTASCLIENHNSPRLIRNQRGKWRKIIRLKFVFEALSDNQNRVTLSNDVLKPRVEFRDSPDPFILNGKQTLGRQLANMLAPLEPEKILMDEKFADTECHIMSTAKMGHSKNDSVVDKNLIHHNYRNLFILGASSFPTTTAANPTLTISALSLMAADLNF